MNTILFGGRQVPVLGQGTWYMGENPHTRAEEIRALQTGIELGMTLIDTAEMYGNGKAEELVGEAVRGRRDSVFIVSKVLPSNASKAGTRQACERSLKRLGTDRIDMYLLHWQGRYPFAETVEAMLALVREGKIASWGVSNMDVDEMEEFYAIPKGDGCATDQILYNLSRRGVEYDLLPWARKRALPVMAYSPVEQGRILGNRALKEVAKAHNATPAQIALAWTLRDGGVLAIPKAAKVEHVRQNAAAAAIALSPEEYAILDAAFPPPTRKTPLEML